MGYIKFFEMDNDGAGFKSLDEISFGDAVEIELALATPNAIQVACVICFTPIPSGTGNTCETHIGQEPNW